MLILQGRSETPVYLLVQDDDVQILPAEHYWGTTVWHTEEAIKTAHQDPQIKVASIGVAGEQGVKYACVVNDLHRAAGRSGVGAVMGSKNLKAIAVRGTHGVPVRDPSRFMKVVEHTHQLLADSAGRKELTEFGTNAMIDTMNAFGGLPTNNFQQVSFKGTYKINPSAMSTQTEVGTGPFESARSIIMPLVALSTKPPSHSAPSSA